MTRKIPRAAAALLVLSGVLDCASRRPPSSDPNGPYGHQMPEDTHDETVRKAIQEGSNPNPWQAGPPHR